MREQEYRQAKERAKIVKAMAHVTRLQIISLLCKNGASNVGDITAAVHGDISTVSRHLSLLKSVGIVKDSTKGRFVYYSVTCSCISDFLECTDQMLKNLHGTPGTP